MITQQSNSLMTKSLIGVVIDPGANRLRHAFTKQGVASDNRYRGVEKHRERKSERGEYELGDWRTMIF